MKSETKYWLIGIIIIIVINLIGWVGIKIIDSNFEEVYDIGYSKGYLDGSNAKIADYKYWCEDKYGWIPKEAVNENDYCSWLSEIENRYYGDFYGDCFGWQQDQWYKMGQELK